ncbi:MAG TPA: OB-fold domain-containing protein [Acidimicrobiales bacterium]|nr:OB-fold domain-containing protein [Acidimicrobiales bacterium]
MTVAGPRPVARNEATAAFFDATAQGRFLLMRCRPAGHWNRPQADRCAECDSTELEPAPASGRAALVSWVVLHPRPSEGGDPGLVTVPAIVELAEGPWWWTEIVGTDPAGLSDGMALEVVFERPEGSEAVPVFTPLASGSRPGG